MHIGYTDEGIVNAVTADFMGRQTDFVNILKTLTVLGKYIGDC
jgi:hypothetical protein